MAMPFDISLMGYVYNVRHYIYLVIDNFSRKILSWESSDVVKAEIRRASIAKASEKVGHYANH